MKNVNVRQYIALRDSLQKEKLTLEARLIEVNRALSGGGSPAAAPKAPSIGKKPKAKARIRNEISLRAAVAQVTKPKALTKAEILAAVEKLGYRFTAPNPINSLNTVLYTNRQFKNVNGRFSPA